MWGGITYLRGLREQRVAGPGRTMPPRARASGRANEENDAIDYEELERAEREVRDLDVDARPEDGFVGDDWGPGAGPKPPLTG